MPEFRPNRGQEIYIIQNVQSDQSHNYQVTFTAEKLKEKKPKISDITIALVYAIKVHLQCKVYWCILGSIRKTRME